MPGWASEEKAREAAKVTIETIDLQLMFDILFVEEDRVKDRFAIWGEGEAAENYELKRLFWETSYQRSNAYRQLQEAAGRRIDILARQVRDLGGDPDWPHEPDLHRPDPTA